MSRTRRANPGACESIKRRAGASQKPYPAGAVAERPCRARSRSHPSKNSRPCLTLAVRFSRRFACAAGSGAASGSAALASCFETFWARFAAHSTTHAGRSLLFTALAPEAKRRSNPSPCLHGNFRLGHEHLNAGSDKSICTWYGSLPEPCANPQTKSSSRPKTVHLRGLANPWAVFSAAGSGASEAAWSVVQLLGTARKKRYPRPRSEPDVYKFLRGSDAWLG